MLKCNSLLTQMAGDFRHSADRLSPRGCTATLGCRDLTDKSGNVVAVSEYLYNLNTAWSSSALTYPPHLWLAIAGSFCPNTVRTIPLLLSDSAGCADARPFNDGVVCEQSARFVWDVDNGPSHSFGDSTYAHTTDWKTWFVFCPSDRADLVPLWNPHTNIVNRIIDLLVGN